MNGRIYDPLLGRFLSADLLIQEPGSLQSYNRYSYVRNNPLTLTDPSGWADDGSSNSGGLLDQLKAYVSVFLPARSPVNPTSDYDTPQQQPQEQQQFQGAVRSANADANRTLEGWVKVSDTCLDLTPGVRPTLDLGQAIFGVDQIGRKASRTEGAKNFAIQVAVGAAIDIGAKPLSEAAGKVVSTVVKAVEKDARPAARIERAAIKAELEPEIERLPNERLTAKPFEPSKAPIGDDGHPVELHHADQAAGNESALQEKTRTDHRLGENFKKNHPNTGDTASKVDRTEFKKMKESHWTKELKSGRFDDLPDQ